MTTAIESTTVPATTAEKTFTVAGVSCLKGEYKVRHANNLDRVKVLQANEHEDIRLIELPHAMSKTEAVQYLISLPTNNEIEDEVLKTFFDDIEAQQAFDDFLAAKAPKVKVPKQKDTKPKKATAVVESKVSVQELIDVDLIEDEVGQRIEEVDTEDQPF